MVVPAGDLVASEVWTIPAAPAHQRPVSSQQLPLFQPGSSAASLSAVQLQPPGAFCRVTLASSQREVCQPVTVQLLPQAQPQMPSLIQPCSQPQLQVQRVQHANTTVFFAGVMPIAQAGAVQAIFEHFGTVCDFNLFRPYKGCKTSKVGRADIPYNYVSISQSVAFSAWLSQLQHVTLAYKKFA